MKVHQAGISKVVALMGSTVSEHQEKLLRPFKSIILFLNGDDAGRISGKNDCRPPSSFAFCESDLTAGREAA